MRVLDLGCGDGHRTRELHRTFRASETIGLDTSAAMLGVAMHGSGNGNASSPAPVVGHPPDPHPAPDEGLAFARVDIAQFAYRTAEAPLGLPPGALDAPFDLIFSNAALHWVPDHARLLPALTTHLAPGGQLAVQVPAMQRYPTHVASAELARLSPFREALGGYVQEQSTLTPSAYARLLVRAGFTQPHVRLQVYPHLLESREEVVRWMRGAHLTDYQARLPRAMFETFVARYQERLFRVLKDDRPFLLPYERILFYGRRPASVPA